MKKYFFIILSILFIACQTDVYKKETLSFNWLLSCFETQIPEQEYIYMLMPSFSCIGCVQHTALHLDSLLVEESTNLTIIYAKNYKDSKYQLEKLSSKALLFCDETDAIEKLNFTVANPTIIKTSNRKIMSIISMDIREIEQTLQKTFNINLIK